MSGAIVAYEIREAAVEEDVRRVVASFGMLSVDASTLAKDDDLTHVGMSSHAGVAVMLALEEAFEIEFPERMLRRSTFASITAIESAVMELLGQED